MIGGLTISGYGTISPSIVDPVRGRVTVADYGPNIVLYQDFVDPETGQSNPEVVETVAKFSPRFDELMRAASPMATPAALQRFLDPVVAFRDSGTVPEAYLSPALTDGPAIHSEPMVPFVTPTIIGTLPLPIDPGMNFPGPGETPGSSSRSWLKPALVIAGIYLLARVL